IKCLVGLVMRRGPHVVGHAEPLLVAVLGLDHPQHDHGCANTQRAAAGEIERTVAFRSVVDDDQELRPVAGFVAAPPGAHDLPGPAVLGVARPWKDATALAGRTSPAGALS